MTAVTIEMPCVDLSWLINIADQSSLIEVPSDHVHSYGYTPK